MADDRDWSRLHPLVVVVECSGKVRSGGVVGDLELGRRHGRADQARERRCPCSGEVGLRHVTHRLVKKHSGGAGGQEDRQLRPGRRRPRLPRFFQQQVLEPLPESRVSPDRQQGRWGDPAALDPDQRGCRNRGPPLGSDDRRAPADVADRSLVRRQPLGQGACPVRPHARRVHLRGRDQARRRHRCPVGVPGEKFSDRGRRDPGAGVQNHP